MVRFCDISEEEGYLQTPRIDRSQVRLLWCVDFWDGPKSGMLLHGNDECWFEMVAENDDDLVGWYRRFVVIRLTDEQLREERARHELFCEKVGTHMNFNEQGARPVGALKSKETWREFYDAYQGRAPMDLSQNTVVAWFET